MRPAPDSAPEGWAICRSFFPYVGLVFNCGLMAGFLESHGGVMHSEKHAVLFVCRNMLPVARDWDRVTSLLKLVMRSFKFCTAARAAACRRGICAAPLRISFVSPPLVLRCNHHLEKALGERLQRVLGGVRVAADREPREKERGQRFWCIWDGGTDEPFAALAAC